MSSTTERRDLRQTGLQQIPREQDDIQGAPKWFSKEYMENCLCNYFKDRCLKVEKVQAWPALGKGENYGGVLTRIRVDFVTASGARKTGHYILKTSYEGNEFAKQKMQPYDVFNREMSIYESVLPQLKALLVECADTEQIFAETVAVDYKRGALLFEDLSTRGFVMPDRVKGLDMKLTKIVLRKLAKMHATSAVLNEREPACLEGYDRGMFNRYTENYSTCYLGLVDACVRMLSQWGSEFSHYASKLSKLRPMYMEYGKRVFDPVSGHVNVLAHGDLWTNNVLVKYDDVSGEPLDVIIIDFQYSVWSSPAIDLWYLLNTSLEYELHMNAQDELIQHYYYVLADTLRKLSYKASIPSLHNFHLQLEEKSFYALNSTCFVQPIQRNEVNDDADFEALMQENERAKNFKDTCYKNHYCQKLIRNLLPVYERKGLLDTDQ